MIKDLARGSYCEVMGWVIVRSGFVLFVTLVKLDDIRSCAYMVVWRVHESTCFGHVGQYTSMRLYGCLTRTWVQIFIEVFRFATERLFFVIWEGHDCSAKLGAMSGRHP